MEMQAFMKFQYHTEYFSSLPEQRQQIFMCSKSLQVIILFFYFYFFNMIHKLNI